MTREEALQILDTIPTISEQVDALEMAIQALSQESILDKIRVEIDRQEKWLLQAGYTAYNVDIAFDSIKSVLAESEE